jgi:hypothetical protein
MTLDSIHRCPMRAKFEKKNVKNLLHSGRAPSTLRLVVLLFLPFHGDLSSSFRSNAPLRERPEPGTRRATPTRTKFIAAITRRVKINPATFILIRPRRPRRLSPRHLQLWWPHLRRELNQS